MQVVETDVLVVGAGPAGLTATGLLAQYGVDAITVTKYADIANSPARTSPISAASRSSATWVSRIASLPWPPTTS